MYAYTCTLLLLYSYVRTATFTFKSTIKIDVNIIILILIRTVVYYCCTGEHGNQDLICPIKVLKHTVVRLYHGS